MSLPKQWPTPTRVVRRYKTAWQQFGPFLGSSKSRIAVMAGGSVIAGLVEAALLALVASLATALSQGQTQVDAIPGPLEVSAPLLVLCAVGLGLAVFRGALQVWLAYVPASMSASVMAALRRDLFERFTSASWKIQSAERDGHFQSLMTTQAIQASAAVTTLSEGISAVLMFFTLLASAFLLSAPTALILIGASAVLFVMLAPLARRQRGHARALSAENVEYAKGVQEMVQLAEETQVFGANRAYRDAVEKMIQEVRRPLLQTRFLNRAVPALYQSVAFFLLLLALMIVHLSGATAIGELGAVVLILIRSLTFGQRIQASSTRMNELIPYMGRLRRALDHYAGHTRQDGDHPLSRVERLGMSHVDFAYDTTAPVLHDVSFEASRGEVIGIVGPSGAGKSSIVQLLLRLRLPTSGTVTVNGQDARDFRLGDWRERVSYVPQSPQLLWGTVADNIRFYRDDITDAEVEEAARKASLHEEILSWPEGYQTVIGQRASAISGGQRQRLCLARALAGRPDVLILDEPTSALDVMSEQAVQESLARMKGEVLLLLVAHRVSTLSICDRVMVMGAGRLQAIDAPSVLMRDNEFFREITAISQAGHTVT
ncbi:ABC transporter ATP-binding protein [Modestobacter sp. VKM Ac-2984]|uniref:ABC transporter ATP-binding protein n=1 Tax=Modestobacter sp. VKM Ac-2984 TaxID=3004138 RepID=UPI0022AB2AED|nr:ABC transporter ATP-binding protein [Modestobacter sp. VKM Ac-2984]MCZ2817339.1 ABC transporter ATP-binding protein [Modestobacter sp. VKM Ac-2984]